METSFVGVAVCDMVNKNNNTDRRESKSTRLKTEERMKFLKKWGKLQLFFHFVQDEHNKLTKKELKKNKKQKKKG